LDRTGPTANFCVVAKEELCLVPGGAA